MPVGHTNKDTINQRRPLTSRQREALDALHGLGNQVHRRGEIAVNNTLRSLQDRGLAEWHSGGHNPDWWSITDAGRLAIGKS